MTDIPPGKLRVYGFAPWAWERCVMSPIAALEFDWSKVDPTATERYAGVSRRDWDPQTGAGLWRASDWKAEDCSTIPEATPLYLGPDELLICVTPDIAPVIRALANRKLSRPLNDMVVCAEGMLVGVMPLREVPLWFDALWRAAATEWLYDYASVLPQGQPGPTDWAKDLMTLMHATPEGGAMSVVIKVAHLRWLDPAYDPAGMLDVAALLHAIERPYLERAVQELESWKGNAEAARGMVTMHVRSLVRHWLEVADRHEGLPFPRAPWNRVVVVGAPQPDPGHGTYYCIQGCFGGEGPRPDPPVKVEFRTVLKPRYVVPERPAEEAARAQELSEAALKRMYDALTTPESVFGPPGRAEDDTDDDD